MGHFGAVYSPIPWIPLDARIESDLANTRPPQMSSLNPSTPAKLTPAPMSATLASAAVQRAMLSIEKEPAVKSMFNQGPELYRHTEAILMATHLNDLGFEAVSKYSVDAFAAELQRCPPSRWIGKAAPPLPTLSQAQACLSLCPG